MADLTTCINFLQQHIIVHYALPVSIRSSKDEADITDNFRPRLFTIS